MTDERTRDEVAAVTALTEKFAAACEGQRLRHVYAALVYCLGRCISVANDPAELLGETIPKLANAAKLNCIALGPDDDLEEILDEHARKSTH
jgi:hypothetical protein